MSEQGAEGTQAAAPAVDLSGIESRISELGQEMNQRFEQFQPAPAQQEQGFEDFSGFDYGQQEPDFQYGQPQVQQPAQEQPNQEGMQLLQNMVGQAVQQAIAPLNQRFEAQDTQARTQAWEQQVDAFEQKYQLDDQASEQLAGKAYEIAGQLADELGQWLPPQAAQALKQANVNLAELIATRPGFLENVFLAGRAQASAEQETPASTSQGTQLEQGGGAAVSDTGTPGDQWLGSGQGQSRSLDQVLGW